jgi:small subunit ribosomal protein S16
MGVAVKIVDSSHFASLTGARFSSMIKLRLKRFGKKFEASYRIVAMNNDTRRDGRPLEELGFYNPRTDEVKLEIPAIVKRLKEGAQPTKTVRHILEKANVYEQLRA